MSVVVPKESAGQRLDVFLTQAFPGQSRSYFQKLIDQGLVLVSGCVVKKRTQVEEGDEIEVEFALTQELAAVPEEIPLDIIFEDEHLIVINKPAGMVVHPAPGHFSGTFANALLWHCKNLTFDEKVRPGIVHRLDKDTTGLLVAAKTPEAHRALVAAFAARSIDKRYLALASGHPKDQRIDLPIGRDPQNRQRMTVTKGGKQATTDVRVLARYKEASLIECHLITGRTHQIRVHLKAIGCPLLGDPIYGAVHSRASRQMLHAAQLKFTHPIKQEELTFIAPLPADMDGLIKNL